MGKTRHGRPAKKESQKKEGASKSRSTSPTIAIDRTVHKSVFEVDSSSPMPLTEAKMVDEIKFLRRNLTELRASHKLEADHYKVTLEDQRKEIAQLKENLRVKEEFIEDLTTALDVKDNEKEKMSKKHARMLKTKEDKISMLMSQKRDVDDQRFNAQHFVTNIGRRHVLIAREMTRMVQRVLMTCSMTNSSIAQEFHRDIARKGSISTLADTLIKLLNLKKDDIPAGEEAEERKLLDDLLNLFSVLFFTPTIRAEMTNNKKYPEFITSLSVFIFTEDGNSLFGNDPEIISGCCEVLEQTCKTTVAMKALSQYENSEGSFYELLTKHVENENERCNDEQVNILLQVFSTVSAIESDERMYELKGLFKRESIEIWEKSSNEALRSSMERYLRIGFLVKK